MPNRALSSRRHRPAAVAQRSQRENLIAAAIALADREGLGAVSIRRVAAELRTRPMSLYTYIASKGELLELMAERVVGEVLIEQPLPTEWRAAVEMITRRSHRVFTAHPWLLEISRTRASLGENGLRHAEQLLAAIAPLNLRAVDAWKALFLINDYALGHALRVVHAPNGPSNSYPPFEPEQFPELSAALGAAPTRNDDTFLAGLQLILGAIERLGGDRGEPARSEVP